MDLGGSGHPIGVRQPTAKPPAVPEPHPRPPERFAFGYAGAVGIAARVVTARPTHPYVEVSDDTLTVRFGPWTLTTPRSNVAEISESGPYAPWKVIGPPRLSMADRGITFATNCNRGVCVRFFEPVTGIEPTGRILHPGMTVTVADPDGLVAALAAR